MRCLNCGRQVDETRVFVARKLRGTYCMRCRPLAVLGNGRRAVVKARKILDEAAELGNSKVLITMRQHRGKTLYEIRIPRTGRRDRPPEAPAA